MHPCRRTWSDYLPAQASSIELNDWRHWPEPWTTDCVPKSTNPNSLNLHFHAAEAIQESNEIRLFKISLIKKIDSFDIRKEIANVCKSIDSLPSKSPSLITRILFSCISNFLRLSKIDRARCGTDVNSFPPKFKRFSFL